MLRLSSSIDDCRCRSSRPAIGHPTEHKLWTIKTDALTLTYMPSGDGHFTPDNLSITLVVDGKAVTWHPGLDDPENLLGTTRTLDGALGSKTQRADRPGPCFALRLGAGRRLHAPALRLRRLPLPRGREEPVAVGHGAARRRKPGSMRLVLLRLRPRLPQSARRLRARGRPHSAAAALRLRRVVVALLGLQRPGTRRAGARVSTRTIRRSTCS